MTRQSTGRLAQHVHASECAFIEKALAKHSGHVTKTSVWLGISRRSLYDKIVAHGLDGVAAGLRCETGIRGPRGGRDPEATATRSGPEMVGGGAIPYLDEDSPERRAFWERHGMTPEQAARPAETLCAAMHGEVE